MLVGDDSGEYIYSPVGNGHEMISHSALSHEGFLNTFEGELPGNNSISSLGIGVSWMKKFWEERGAERKRCKLIPDFRAGVWIFFYKR